MKSTTPVITRFRDWTLIVAALAATGCSPVESETLGKTGEGLITIEKLGSLGTSFIGAPGPRFSLGGRTIITEHRDILRISPPPENEYALDGQLPALPAGPGDLQQSQRLSANDNLIARGVTAGTAGTVEVWQRSSAGWSLSTKLSSPDASIDDRFGYHVFAAPGRIAVGAPRSDVALTDAGAVYIFDLVGTAWQHTATLVSPNPVAGEGLVLTALHGDVVAAAAGARAIVFQRAGCKWIDLPSPEPPSGANVKSFEIISLLGSLALARIIGTTPDQHDQLALRSYRRESAGWVDEGEIHEATNYFADWIWLTGALGAGIVAVGVGYSIDDADPGTFLLFERTARGFDTANPFEPRLSSGDLRAFVAFDLAVSDDLVAWNEPLYGVSVARFSTSTDAGTPPSLPADAGCGSAEAGGDGSPDADGDASPDADGDGASSVPIDSGNARDAADSADSNASSDAGTVPDARLGQPDATPSPVDSGAGESCGCRIVSPARPTGAALGMWVLALFGIRSRRQSKK
jgi:hypothetical protein